MNKTDCNKAILATQIKAQTAYDAETHADISSASTMFQMHHYLTHLTKYKLRLEERTEWLSQYQENPGMSQKHDQNLVNLGMILLSTMRASGTDPENYMVTPEAKDIPLLNKHLRWLMTKMAKIIDDSDHASCHGTSENERAALWAQSFDTLSPPDGSMQRYLMTSFIGLIDVYHKETGRDLIYSIQKRRGLNHYDKYGPKPAARKNARPLAP